MILATKSNLAIAKKLANGFIRNGHTGNLIIQFSIEFPKSLTKEQITKIENIF